MYRLQYLLELLDLMTPHFDGYEYYEFDDFALPRGGSDLGLQGPTFSYAVGTLRTTQYQSVCYHINQKKKNKMCTHAAMRIECLAVHELCPGQTCFPQMIANHYRETQSILSPLNIVALQRRMFLQHSKIRIVIAYMYGIMIIERSSLVGQFPWPNKSCFLPKRLLISSQDRVRIVLLLLLLRRLSSLVLKLLDRLLRVALVAAVGLDLYHKLALAKDPLSLSFACVLVASPRLADSNLQRFRYH